MDEKWGSSCLRQRTHGERVGARQGSPIFFLDEEDNTCAVGLGSARLGVGVVLGPGGNISNHSTEDGGVLNSVAVRQELKPLRKEAMVVRGGVERGWLIRSQDLSPERGHDTGNPRGERMIH